MRYLCMQAGMALALCMPVVYMLLAQASVLMALHSQDIGIEQCTLL